MGQYLNSLRFETTHVKRRWHSGEKPDTGCFSKDSTKWQTWRCSARRILVGYRDVFSFIYDILLKRNWKENVWGPQLLLETYWSYWWRSAEPFGKKETVLFTWEPHEEGCTSVQVLCASMLTVPDCVRLFLQLERVSATCSPLHLRPNWSNELIPSSWSLRGIASTSH